MLRLIQQSLASQMQAALGTLARCEAACPDEAWDAPIVELKFCQVQFHALFFADYYLGREDPGLLREQGFHQEHAAQFRDYEELEPRRQVHLYPREFIRSYAAFCFGKAAQIIHGEGEETLGGESGFHWLPFPRAEVHAYNARHVHHHAAQLSLWLRQQQEVQIGWVRDAEAASQRSG